MTIRVDKDISGAAPAREAYMAFHVETHDYTTPYGTGATPLEALEELRWEVSGREGWEDVLDEVDAAIDAARLAQAQAGWSHV